MSNRSLGNVINSISNRRYELLGAGSRANVYSHPRDVNKVIKIGPTLTDGWLDYIQWAKERGYCGTLAPVVYSLKIFKFYYIAVIQRLESFEDYEHVKLIKKNVMLSKALLFGADNISKLKPREKNFVTDFRSKFKCYVDLGIPDYTNLMFKITSNGKKEIVVNDPIYYRMENLK